MLRKLAGGSRSGNFSTTNCALSNLSDNSERQNDAFVVYTDHHRSHAYLGSLIPADLYRRNTNANIREH